MAIQATTAKKEVDFDLVKSLLAQLAEQSELMNDEIENAQESGGEVPAQVKENTFLHIGANKGGVLGEWILAERIKHRGPLNGDPNHESIPAFYQLSYEVDPDNKELRSADNTRARFTDRILGH